MNHVRFALLALLGLGLARAQDAAPVTSAAVERYYEIFQRGQKLGYSKVTWAPSTWNGRPTLRDQTTVVRRSVRNMSGYKTVFETRVEIELERGYDGTLWWQRTTGQEANRQTLDSPFIRQEANEALGQITQHKVSYPSAGEKPTLLPSSEESAAIQRWKSWWPLERARWVKAEKERDERRDKVVEALQQLLKGQRPELTPKDQ